MRMQMQTQMQVQLQTQILVKDAVAFFLADYSLVGQPLVSLTNLVRLGQLGEFYPSCHGNFLSKIIISHQLTNSQSHNPGTLDFQPEFST